MAVVRSRLRSTRVRAPGRCLVAAAALAAVLLVSPTFLAGGDLQPLRRRATASSPVLRRGAGEAAVEAEEKPAEPRPLQLPEANYFINQKIMGCLKEGCDVDVVEDLIERLARDEARIQEGLEELRAAQRASHSADIAETIGWFRSFLDNSQHLRDELLAVRGFRHATSDFVKQFVRSGRHRVGGDASDAASPNDNFAGMPGAIHLGTFPAKTQR